MATAVRKEIPQPKYEVVLTLSLAEAETLRAVGNRVGGSPDVSRRKHFDAINLALSSVGITNDTSDMTRDGGVYFRP